MRSVSCEWINLCRQFHQIENLHSSNLINYFNACNCYSIALFFHFFLHTVGVYWVKRMYCNGLDKDESSIWHAILTLSRFSWTASSGKYMLQFFSLHFWDGNYLLIGGTRRIWSMYYSTHSPNSTNSEKDKSPCSADLNSSFFSSFLFWKRTFLLNDLINQLLYLPIVILFCKTIIAEWRTILRS